MEDKLINFGLQGVTGNFVGASDAYIAEFERNAALACRTITKRLPNHTEPHCSENTVAIGHFNLLHGLQMVSKLWMYFTANLTMQDLICKGSIHDWPT